MKNLFRIFSICLFSANSYAQSIISEPEVAEGDSPVAQAQIAIIPEPVSLMKKAGTFTLPENISIQASKSEDLQQAIVVLSERIETATGKFVSRVTTANHPTIKLIINPQPDAQLGMEGYKLNVNPTQIVISANKPAGIFWGVQSLIQLFPVEIESKEMVENVKWKLPCVDVIDYPKLGWRGLMFDVARHFFTKEEVKKFIDNMVRYKFNLLHFHLTDDEGW
ncbi:glycoside hydrolase family 20 zincin-like fold domain-containing protein, partial [Pedobacter agri]